MKKTLERKDYRFIVSSYKSNMIQHYSLFYSYKTLGDILIVIIDNSKPMTRKERKGKVDVIYNEDEIIGYNILNVSEVIKIKTKGQIFLPSSPLIKVINTILKNSGVEELGEINESGYVVGKVMEMKLDDNKYLLKVDIGNEIINVLTKSDNIQINDCVVIAKVNTMLNSGETVKESEYKGLAIRGKVCSEKQLQISDSDLALVFKEDTKVGTDFFREEKE